MAAVVVMPGSSEADMRHDTLTLVTAGGAKKIDIEIASSMEEQMKGLMFRTSLPDNAGMLFPYSPPRELTMWMKNTYIPLDMVFIRADGIVHRIEVRTEPHSETVISSGGAYGGGAGACRRGSGATGIEARRPRRLPALQEEMTARVGDGRS